MAGGDVPAAGLPRAPCPGCGCERKAQGKGRWREKKGVGLGDFRMSSWCESLVKEQSRHGGDVVLKRLLAMHLKLNIHFHGAPNSAPGLLEEHIMASTRAFLWVSAAQGNSMAVTLHIKIFPVPPDISLRFHRENIAGRIWR